MTHRPKSEAAAPEPAAAETRRRRRDRALRRRFEDSLTPGLPVDADAPGARVPVARVGSLLDALLAEALTEKSAFFDAVCADWAALAPGVAARPGRFQDGRLFLYVKSSAALFALRPRLPKLRRTLAALPSAPKRFTLHLEIHA